MEKYKVGDIVYIKPYDEATDHIYISRDTWEKEFQYACEIIKVVDDACKVRGELCEWFIKMSSIKCKANNTADKIVITTDGAVTLARMYEGNTVVKSAEARCSPEDTYDFNIGARIAFDRLVGTDNKPEEAVLNNSNPTNPNVNDVEKCRSMQKQIIMHQHTICEMYSKITELQEKLYEYVEV